jgi:hypothetical protein
MFDDSSTVVQAEAQPESLLSDNALLSSMPSCFIGVLTHFVRLDEVTWLTNLIVVGCETSGKSCNLSIHDFLPSCPGGGSIRTVSNAG